MYSKHQIDYDKVFRILIYVCPLVIILYCFSSGISGNDFWWHIKVGEYICEHHSIPQTDIFSWVGIEKGISWTAHEWLSDVIFYLIYNSIGQVGIFLLSICSALLMTGLLWYEAREYLKKNVLVGGLFLALFSVLTSLFFYGRPHLFSFFLLFAELKILYIFISNPISKSIYIIPAIAALWSNLHGGSSNLSYILCILFLIIGCVNLKIGKVESVRLAKGGLVKLGAVTIASIGAIYANPIGYRVFIYPYQSFADSISMSVISEWQAPDAKLIGNLILYFLPIAIVTIGMIVTEKNVELIDIGVMSLFLFLFFRSARFIILWYIAAVFYGLKYMPDLKVKEIKKAMEKIAILVCAILLIVPVVLGLIKTFETGKRGNLIGKVMQDDAITAIKKDAPERLFNDYNIGETLIYNDIPVFFDARADLFAQENIMADGISLIFLEQANKTTDSRSVNVDQLINEYQIDAIAILKVRPLYSYIVSHPEQYRLIYDDSEIAYFRVEEN